MKEQTKLRIAIAIFFAILLLILAGVVWLIVWVASYLTLPVTLLLFGVLLFLGLRFLLRVIVFPGSVGVWRRSIEAFFCKELSSQLLFALKDIETGLLIILERASDYEKRDFLGRAIEASLQSKQLVLSFLECLHSLPSKSKRQKSLLEALQLLLMKLKDIIVVLPDQKTCSYWDWIDAVQSETEWLELILEDFPQNYAGFEALDACQDLMNLLSNSCRETTIVKSFLRWLYDDSLGTLPQMKNDLQKRFKIESEWIKSQDGTMIDCIWMPSENSQASALLFLNPNAGFMEASYYQNEWIEYYLNKGLHIMLMNYRGYGRSSGYPSPKNLKMDAEAVADYLLNVKRVPRLGVHGESLGGMLAVHLGRVRPISYLYVDRSFSSLGDVARFNFSECASFFLKLISRWDSDCALDYIFSDCYKVMSTDPLDTMIKDGASLKNGVALRLLETQGLHHFEGAKPARINMNKYSHIFPPEQFEVFFKSYMEVMKYVINYDKFEDDNGNLSRDMTSRSSYYPMNKEGFEEDYVSNLLYNVLTIIDGLDAGGKLLSSVYNEKWPKLSLKMWILTLDVWGSYYPIRPGEEARGKAIEKLKEAIESFKGVSESNNYTSNPIVVDVIRCIKHLQHSLAFLAGALEESSFDSMSPRVKNRAGFLLPLACGHSGQYNFSEKSLAEWHLERSGILNN